MSFLLGFLLFIPMAIAQKYEFQMEGSYSYASTRSPTLVQVNFNLLWSEKDGRIYGVYSDSVFTKGTQVSGTHDTGQRVFNVIFPEAVDGKISATLTTLETGSVSSTIPVTVSLIDFSSIMQNEIPTTALMSTNPVLQAQESECEERFGMLTGYCGTYLGTVTEEQDPNQLCHLTSYPQMTLVLAPDASVVLNIGDAKHDLGTLPSNPVSSTVAISARHCGSLFGTTYAPNGCQSMKLSGTFSQQVQRRLFTGRYTIQDETGGGGCVYNFTLDRR